MLCWVIYSTNYDFFHFWLCFLFFFLPTLMTSQCTDVPEWDPPTALCRLRHTAVSTCSAGEVATWCTGSWGPDRRCLGPASGLWASKRSNQNEANRNVGNVCSCVFICITDDGSVKAGEREVEEARKRRKMPAYLVLVWWYLWGFGNWGCCWESQSASSSWPDEQGCCCVRKTKKRVKSRTPRDNQGGVSSPPLRSWLTLGPEDAAGADGASASAACLRLRS